MATRHIVSSLFLGFTLVASATANAWPHHHSSHTALEYYRGTWVCTDDTSEAGKPGKPDQPLLGEGNQGQQEGDVAPQRYLTVTQLTDYWYEFLWTSGNVPGSAVLSKSYASYQHIRGDYTRTGLNSDGSSIHWSTPGWVNGALVWSGTVNGHNGNVDTRVTDQFIDNGSFHTVYEVSPDYGNTWQRQAIANCTRALP
ncbi:MAG TPA: hypothetical protein VFH51_00980 [Myxococcota bacterium]|nr:hypothetical protein [Myxococcota bacterium]